MAWPLPSLTLIVIHKKGKGQGGALTGSSGQKLAHLRGPGERSSARFWQRRKKPAQPASRHYSQVGNGGCGGRERSGACARKSRRRAGSDCLPDRPPIHRSIPSNVASRTRRPVGPPRPPGRAALAVAAPIVPLRQWLSGAPLSASALPPPHGPLPASASSVFSAAPRALGLTAPTAGHASVARYVITHAGQP